MKRPFPNAIINSAKQPCLIVGSSEDGECKDHISGRHDYETPDDGRFVVLCLVRDKTADEAQHIDACIETGIDDRAGFLFKSEFRTEEQHQYCVHDVVSEPLAHVGKGRRYQTFGMVFEHDSVFRLEIMSV